MGRRRRTALAGVVYAGLLVSVIGCSGSRDDAVPPESGTAASSTAVSTGPNKTLQDYLAETGITETQARPGDPGVPLVTLPEPPPGWVDAENETPDFAIGALVYSQPQDPADPPTIMVVLVKLSGGADPAKVLEYAPGELRNLPDYQPLGEPAPATLAGRDAVQLSGTYVRDGVRRVIAQKTTVIPEPDALYVLQINADGLEGEQLVLQAATAAIDQFTTIAPAP